MVGGTCVVSDPTRGVLFVCVCVCVCVCVYQGCGEEEEGEGVVWQPGHPGGRMEGTEEEEEEVTSLPLLSSSLFELICVKKHIIVQPCQSFLSLFFFCGAN